MTSMKDSDKLRALADFIDQHQLNGLVAVKGPCKLSVNWPTTTANQRRIIKRVFGPLKVRGGDFFRWLEGRAEFLDCEIRLDCNGAFVCQITGGYEVNEKLSPAQIEARKAGINKLQQEIATGSVTVVKHTYDCNQVDPREDA